jgi:hypothetical protein
VRPPIGGIGTGSVRLAADFKRSDQSVQQHFDQPAGVGVSFCVYSFGFISGWSPSKTISFHQQVSGSVSWGHFTESSPPKTGLTIKALLLVLDLPQPKTHYFSQQIFIFRNKRPALAMLSLPINPFPIP